MEAELIAYQGKDGCTDVRCTRMRDAFGWDMTRCVGFHCAQCDAPCSSQGHRECAEWRPTYEEVHCGD